MGGGGQCILQPQPTGQSRPFDIVTVDWHIHKNEKMYQGECEFQLILIIKGFRTVVFIFIVISPTFWPICPPEDILAETLKK